MKRITNSYLAAKLESVHEDIRDIKVETKKNTEFRLKAKGIISAVGFIAAAVGGIIVWILNKVVGGK